MTVGVIPGGVASRRKLAVIVPLPPIVTVVNADEEFVKVVDATSLLQDEKV